MLVSFFIGIISYNVSIKGVSIGSLIFSSSFVKNDYAAGSSTLLKFMTKKLRVCLLESFPCSGFKFLRSSGSSGKIILKNKFYSIIKLKSGLSRKFNNLCCATVGKIFLLKYKLPFIKKAGLSRLLNIRPSVRGIAMNPVDHPYGGGKGKKSSKSILMGPWGKILQKKK
jgi:large subunit ribosomal protein L2